MQNEKCNEQKHMTHDYGQCYVFDPIFYCGHEYVRVKNISYYEICLETRHKMKEGDRMYFLFFLPNNLTINIQKIMLWSQRIKDDKSYINILLFHNVNEVTASILSDYFASYLILKFPLPNLSIYSLAWFINKVVSEHTYNAQTEVKNVSMTGNPVKNLHTMS